jgi:cold shock CspA family protein
MYRGKFKMFDTEKGFGFIAAPEFPGNIFCHTRSIWLPPGEFPSPGDECEFDVGHDRLGRPVANNVRVTRRAETSPAAEPAGRQQYPTRQMRAEPSAYPTALERDRVRHFDRRGRRDALRRDAEKLWVHPGMDDV